MSDLDLVTYRSNFSTTLSEILHQCKKGLQKDERYEKKGVVLN